MSEEIKPQITREELVRGKFAEVQKLIFTSGLTVGEIASIINACQNNLNNLGVNMNMPTPVAPPAVEEVKPEVKE
jgi:hypothetical protein